MLQSVQLDSSPAPAKSRSGTENGSDPALAVFAGMMAQAASPARAPEVQPREASTGRAEPKVAARTEEPTEARGTVEKPGEAKVDQREASAEKTPPTAKGKDQEPARTAEDLPPVAQGREGAATAGTAQAQPLPAGVDLPQAAQAPAPIAANAVPQPSSPQPPENAGPQPPSAVPKELKVTAEVAPEIQGSAAQQSKPQAALRELLHLPKVEIETPKLPSEAPAKVQAGPVSGAGQTETHGDKPAIDAGEATPADAAAKAPTLDVDQAPLLKAEAREMAAPQATTAKAGTPEAAMLPAVETPRPVQAPVHAEAAAPARPSPILNQVEGSIRWILQNKSQGAELQLHPESLGRVVIQLKVEGQEVHARLWTSESASLAVLQDHKAFLETSLKEQGLILSTFDLQSGARGNSAQTAFQEQAGTAPRALPHLEVMQEMPTELRLDPADPYRVEVYA